MTQARGRWRKRSATQAVTLSDVAAAAGVSAQTVSRAIRDPASVSKETGARIERAIAKTGYVRNLFAANLASNRSQTVAAVIPAMNASVFAETLHAFEERLRPHGYQIFVGSSDYHADREEALVRSFLGRRPDGFLLVGTEHTTAARKLLTALPVVETWDLTDRPIDVLVGFSGEAATAELVAHLAERGRRRITFASRQLPGDQRSAERLAGYTQAVTALGAEPRTVEVAAGTVTMDLGVELLDLALARFPDSDAVMFSSDVFAAGALLACVRRGIDVPGRLAITGFGDFELARHLVPALTTVAVPQTRIGELAADLLLDRIHGRSVAEPVRDVGYRIEIRASS
ncbi:LacI family DNA-binding transcriptional regulator [Actinophytocola sp.]|uniref:LacI family DNA-binding transcriptional regulator n=1 Tax=Actinophytocola sp. TaxID=1872138 RepID=UPI00389AC4FC